MPDEDDSIQNDLSLDVTDPTGGDAPTDLEAPTDSGQGEETVNTPEPSYLDLDSIADQKTRLKIGDEDVEVSVSDLRNGYLRQQDYTRKTQSLAEERAANEYAVTLAEALRQNPRETIAYLQSQIEAQGVAAAEVDEWPEDPEERRLAEIEAQVNRRLAPIEAAHAAREVQEHVARLSTRYGDDFVAEDVVNEALRRGHRDHRQLEAVYKEMAFDRYRASELARQDLTAKQAVQTQAKVDAKSQIVSHSGGSSNVTPAPTVTQPTSLREAWNLAAQQLGQPELIY